MMDPNTILIIDDELAIRDSLTSFFEDEGYTVFSAENGKKGLAIFFNNEIDIVLTDLKMPKKDGLEVMKAIHNDSPDTPMIVVSGAGEKEDIINALRMGAKDYITKPIHDLDRISHTVKHILENKLLKDENRLYRKRLEKSETQYRNITENIAEGVFTVDEFENIQYANKAFCTMLGYSNEQILQKNLKNITSKEHFDIIEKQTLKRKMRITSRYEIQMIDKNNQAVHIELACTPIFGDEDLYQGTIAVARDITEIIELREKYQKYFVHKKNIDKDVLSICASCKNIRIDDNNWINIEEYFKNILFSHGICPKCCKKLYPEFDFSDIDIDTNDTKQT
jgi:PAS domain S-box-containing protein